MLFLRLFLFFFKAFNLIIIQLVLYVRINVSFGAKVFQAKKIENGIERKRQLNRHLKGRQLQANLKCLLHGILSSILLIALQRSLEITI